MSQLFNYIAYDFWELYGDKLSSSRVPWVDGGPWRIFAVIGVYLTFVLYLGPRYMRNRPAFELKRTILWYDWFHVVTNGVCSLYALYITRGTLTCWSCQQTGDPSNFHDMANLWLTFAYFLAKFVDMFDTVFFVLRKKQRQVSTLHVCHHAVMPFAAWSALKFAPVGRTAFVGIINSIIHTLMYTYYGLAAMGLHRQLWWKKYITRLQMVQFVAIIVHSVQGAFFIPCSFPVGISVLEFLHGLLFLRSFYAFFKNDDNYKPSQTGEKGAKLKGG